MFHSSSIRLLLVGLLVPLVFGHTVAQRIMIHSVKGLVVPASPGELLTLPLRFSSQDVNPTIGRLQLDAPSGWKLRTSSGPVTVRSDKQVVSLPSFTVPRNAVAGPYNIAAVLADSNGTPLGPSLAIVVRVVRVVSFTIRLVDAPRYAVGGQRLTHQYELTNTGNDQTTYSFETSSSLGYPIEIPSPIVSIAPGMSERILVHAFSPSSTRSKELHTLTLKVIPAPDGEAQTLTTTSDVVPRASSSSPTQVEYPIYGKAVLTKDNDDEGVQGEFFGIGSLSRSRGDKLEFLLRSPQTQTITALGIRDEYKARYTSGPHSAYIGDWNYALTTLTEVGQYAFGAGGQTEIGGVTAGGFFNRTRIGDPDRRQAAGYLRFALSPSFSAGANILRRSDKQDATITSATVVGTPFGATRLALEAARSAAASGNDAAFTARLSGSAPVVTYDVQLVHAGPNFASYYRDMQVASLSLSARASNTVRLELLARDESRNIQQDTLFGSAPRSRFLQFGGGFANMFAVYYRASTYVDPTAPSRPDRREDVVQLRASRQFDVALLSLFADIGSITERSAGLIHPTRHVALSVNAEPLAGMMSSATMDLSRTPELTTGTMQERISASIASTYYFSQGTTANVNLHSSRTQGMSAVTFTIVEAGVEHVFPSQHRLGGRLRSTTITGTNPEFAVALDYSVPLAIPMGSDPTFGILEGRIVDGDGKGVAGVYLTAGAKSSLTDDEGNFIIRDIPPGEQLVTVDRATLGLQRITHVPLPVTVLIQGGRETTLPLRTIRPASLEGRIRLFSSVPSGIRDSSVIVEDTMNGQVILAIELEAGSEKVRAISDSRGRFFLSDLRPGRWSATFKPIVAPSNVALERTSAVIDIQEGETESFDVRIVPRRKTVRIIQEGGVLKPKQ